MTTDFALLAPVPAVHLESALKTCVEQGKVAFGSNAGSELATFDAIAGGQELIDVLIYASGGPPSPPKVTWRAVYIGIVPARGGAHPAGMRFRPQSTAAHAPDNSDWMLYWEVKDLRKLAATEQMKISTLFGIDNKIGFKSTFFPHRPTPIQKSFA